MTTTFQRACTTLAKQRFPSWSHVAWEDLPFVFQCEIKQDVRAVLQEIREPDEKMAEVGCAHIPMSDHGAMIAAACCWKDMIDSILSEAGSGQE